MTFHSLEWQMKGKYFEIVASVILRVPGLFLLEHWWEYSVAYTWPHSQDVADIFGALIANLVLLQGLLILLLSLENLVILYMHYISIGLVFVGCFISRYYVATELELVDSQEGSPSDDDGIERRLYHFSMSQVFTVDSALRIAKEYRDFALGKEDILTLSAGRGNSLVYGIFHGATSEDEFYFFRRQIAAIFIQVVLASFISFCLDVNCHYKRVVLAVYTLPIVFRFSGMPIGLLLFVHKLSSACIILTIIFYIMAYTPDLANFAKSLYFHLYFELQTFGVSLLLIDLFNQLYVPMHFLIFWCVKFLFQLYDDVFYSESNSNFVIDRWYMGLLWSVTEVCQNSVTFLSTVVAIAYLSSSIQRLVQVIIQGPKAVVNDRYPKAGVTEGLTFFLLGIQTGFIHIKMPHRLAAMTVILFVVSASLIQSIFEVIEPLLLSLGAQRGTSSIFKQCKVLLMCLILFICPLYMSSALAKIFDIDFWTLVVMSSCLMTSVQVAGLLVIHIIFVYDSYRTNPWEALDDIIYYTRAVVRFLEFIIAVFIVGAGFHESLAGTWSWSNSIILLVHCYFNVWQKLQIGWMSFLQRREAVQKINALPCATLAELQKLSDDVCSICYEPMVTSARKTPCNHFFHGACLRKWLYIQEKCPNCATKVSPIIKEQTGEEIALTPEEFPVDSVMPTLDEIRRIVLEESVPPSLPRLSELARLDRARQERTRSETFHESVY